MRKNGFTLVELLVVVMIISVLTAIAIPQYRKALDRSRAAEAAQLLPALFESRARWMTQHNCVWDGSGQGYTCADGQSLSFKKLDIEVKGTVSGSSLETDTFTYSLFGSGANKRCVVASAIGPLAKYGDNMIYYGGKKITCDGGNSNGQPDALHTCAQLGLTDEVDRYVGCVY